MSYPIDNMLRPPVEFVPAAISLTGAIALLLWHPLFGLTPVMALGLATLLVMHAAWRAQQGLRIVRYRRGLERPRPYMLTPDTLPKPTHQVFIGRGFRWTARHTQRWYDLQRELSLRDGRDANRRSADSLLARIRRDGFGAALLVSLLPGQAAPRLSAAQELGGSLGMHGVEPDEEDVCLNISERPGHVLVVGTTRVGKSRLLEVLVSQDIHCGNVVIVLDPKGDLGVLQRMYAEASRAGRTDNFYFFHLGYPDLSARYNPIGDFTRITEIADRIANGVPGEGAAATFKQFVWHYVNGTMRGVVALGERPSYKCLRKYMNDCDGLAVRYLEWWLDRTPEAKGWREEIDAARSDNRSGGDRELRERNPRAWKLSMYVQRKKLQDDVAESLISLISHPRAHFEKLVASVKPLIEKLTNGKAGELLSPEYTDATDHRPVFDWNTIVANGGIVYVGLDALSSSSVAAAVGSSMFADLTSIASRIYKHGIDHGQSSALPPRKLSIHADEFNELIGDEFIPMINKAGGAGFQVVAYTQTAADIEAKIGTPAKARQIEGNFNTRIYMRVLDDVTAEGFVLRVPEVYVASVTAVSRAADSSTPVDFADFTSMTEDKLTLEKVTALSPADLGQLPKGHAFALLNGGQLYKLRIPLIETQDDPHFVSGAPEIARQLASRYQDAARPVADTRLQPTA
ncbi:MAG: type IV conjugative transfer system coupling protein TraD [Rhizobacter sp.]